MLTRTDGDSRGGAALSMRHVTGLPIKFLGSGEKIDALEPFDARRMAGRILGAGDVVALVEKASQEIDPGSGREVRQEDGKGQFDLEDHAMQLKQMQKMGGMAGIMGFLPGVQKVKKQLDASGHERRCGRQDVRPARAIISSMTPAERKNPTF